MTTTSDETLAQFLALFRAGRVQDATDLVMTMQDRVSSPRDHPALGRCQLRLGLFDPAEQALEAALRDGIDHEHERFHAIADLAATKRSLGKFDEAKRLGRSLRTKEWHAQRLHGISVDDPAYDLMRAHYGKFLRNQSVKNKVVTVFPFGGFGDVIEHVRYVEDLKQAGAAAVHFYPQWQLGELLFNSRLPIDWGPYSGERLRSCHYWAFIGDLWLRFESGAESAASRRDYLRPVRPRASSISLPPCSKKSGARKVGIVWRSDNTTSLFEPYRSMRIESLARVFDTPHIQFYSLQFGAVSDAEAAMLAAHGVAETGAAIRSFADMADLILQLDLLISVDSAPVHLAGACGIPTWVMLTSAADSRWGPRNLNTTRLYPSMRLFRQTALGDWQPVVDEVAAALRSGA